MIVFTVLYPYGPDKHFDMDYYVNSHCAFVKEKCGDALKGFTIDSGVGSGEPGSPPKYTTVTRLFFDSMEDFATYMAPHSPTLNADIVNFTDITPEFQVSEAVI